MKFGFNAPSAINSKTLDEYFDNVLAAAPLELKLILAPKKSTSSLKAVLEILVVPLPIRVLVISEMPFLSPSAYGSLSNVRLNATLGNLWFSTTITFKPFFNSNVNGFPIFTVGATPGFGWGIICPCIISVKNKLDKINIDFFMIYLSFELYL